MSELTLTESHIAPVPKLKIEYEGITPENSLLEINPDKLSEILKTQGLKNSELKPLVISESEGDLGGTLSEYDMKTGKVIFHQRAFIDTARKIYQEFMTQAGLENPIPDEHIIARIGKKILQSKYFPTQLPYLLVKGGISRDLEPGNKAKVRSLLKRIAKGSAYPGLSDQERIEKSKRVVQKLTEYTVKNTTSWILSHEYEHIHDRWKKVAIRLISGAAPLAAGISLISTYAGNDVGLFAALGFGSMLTMGAGSIAGVGYDENQSYIAGDKFFKQVSGAVKIRPEVFQSKVIGSK